MKKNPEKGIITIAFDDAYLDTLRYAVDYLNKLNIPSTIAVPYASIGKRLEKRPVAGIEKLRSAINSGHEIASHGLTHRNLLELSLRDQAEAIMEISSSKKLLHNAFKTRITSFVFPYIENSQSQKLRSIAKKHYKTSRITGYTPYFNKLPITDSCSVKGFAVMKNHSLAYLNRQVDRAERESAWLIEVFHLVGKKNTPSAHKPELYRFFTHIDDFKRHIDYMLSKDVAILTQARTVKLFGAQIPKVSH